MDTIVSKLPIKLKSGGGSITPPNPDANYITDENLENILEDYVQSSELANVAFTGSYNDLLNKPEINLNQQEGPIVMRTSFYLDVWRLSSPNTDKTLDRSGVDAIIKVPDSWLNTDYSKGCHYGLDIDRSGQLWFYIASKTFTEGIYLLNRLTQNGNGYVPYCIRDLDYKQNLLGFCKCFTYAWGDATRCELHVHLPYHINIIEDYNSTSYLKHHRCIIQCIGEGTQDIDETKVFFYNKLLNVETYDTYVDNAPIQTNCPIVSNAYYEVDLYKTVNSTWVLNLKTI